MTEYAPKIAEVLSNWLYQETVESTEGNNAVLDGYPSELENERFIFGKQEAHYGRMQKWLDIRESCVRQEEKDDCAALITFGGLMKVSGAYRKECFILATSAEDYMYRRKHSKSPEDPIGVASIDHLVRVRLSRIEAAGGAKAVDIRKSADFAFSKNDSYDSHTANRLRYPDTFSGIERYDVASFTRRQQRLWLGFSVESIAVALAERGGDLEAVPMKKPMSISNPDQATEYPFQD